MMKKLFSISVFVVLSVLLSCSKLDIHPDLNGLGLYFADSSDRNPNNEKYLALLQRGKTGGLPGLSVLIFTGQDGLWVGASGYADLKDKVKMSPANLFRLASITKSFVSTAVLKLAEDHLLDLDEPLDTYVSSSMTRGIANAGSATVRQTLQHTSGVYDFIDNSNFKLAVINAPYKVWSCRDKLDFARGKDPSFAPGEGWKYSNSNYLLLGEAIEKVSGMTFEAYIRKIIFEPLHMNYTWFGSENRFPEGLVRSYVDMYGNGTLRDISAMDAGVFSAEGGLISTAYDIGLFIGALFDKQIINEQSLLEMMKFVPCEFPQNYYTQYGLGLMNWITAGGIGYGHGGSLTGFSTEMFYFPDRKTILIVLCNVGSMGTSPLDQHYQDFLFDLSKTVLE